MQLIHSAEISLLERIVQCMPVVQLATVDNATGGEYSPIITLMTRYAGGKLEQFLRPQGESENGIMALILMESDNVSCIEHQEQFNLHDIMHTT